jgi:hypothetical protein
MIFFLAPEFTKGLDLFVKNGGNGLDRITILELPSEWNLSTGMNAGHSFGNWDEYLR